jgi:hypothetical protein
MITLAEKHGLNIRVIKYHMENVDEEDHLREDN